MDKWRSLLKKLNEALKELEELERLGCRVEAALSLEIRLPEVKAEDCLTQNSCSLNISSHLDALRVLAALAEANLLDEAEELLHLLRIPSYRLVITTLLSLGRASAKELKRRTGLPEATIYRTLKRLRERGLIHEVDRISPKRRGGPRTRIYALRMPTPNGYNTIQSDISDTIYQTINSPRSSQEAA